MNNRSLLIVGCGDIGHRVGNILLSDNSHVSAVRRKPHDPDSQFHWIGADYSCPGSLDFMEQLRPDVVLATFTPSSMDTSGYRRGFTDAAVNVVRGLGKHRPRLVIMVSSTRVYAEASGGWVDESSALSTVDDRAVAIIEAEQHFLASDFPGTVVRKGGCWRRFGEARSLLPNPFAIPIVFTVMIAPDFWCIFWRCLCGGITWSRFTTAWITVPLLHTRLRAG